MGHTVPGDATLHDAEAVGPEACRGVDDNDGDDEINRMHTSVLAEKAKEYKKKASFADEAPTNKERTLLYNAVLDNSRDDKDGHHSHKKGAFAGVFVPTCENMWGVLIFLRFYTIVGQAGVGQALLAVLISFCCAFCTTCSMSATVSSGGVVSQGGPYYMISRALGPSVGASVGVMYWLAITMLAVLEILGAVEGMLMVSDEIYFESCNRVYGLVLMFMLALFVYGGINIVTKLGIFFVFVVAATLTMFYSGLIMAPSTPGAPESVLSNSYVTGLDWETLKDNWGSHYTQGKNFGYVLSVFFPCFTGILSGANRADVLKDPPRDLRRGTFAAIIFSLFMYSSYMILWGLVAHYKYLQGEQWPAGEDPGRRLAGGAVGTYVVDEIVWNPFPSAAKVGIIISSLSQALQCLVVAPRLLNALAKDHIISFLDPLAPTHKGEPKRALLATTVIGSLLVLMGELDLVAPLLSMCFLVAYAFMNFSCFALTWLKSVAWRPAGIHKRRYRLWYLGTSFCGFLICLGIMYTIDHWWAIIATTIALCLYIFINWQLETKGWGSAVDGIRYQFALDSLVQLEKSQTHSVNWRPQILILYKIHLSDELKGIKKHEILNLYSQLRKANGFCVVACVLEASERSDEAIRKAKIEKDVIQSIMKEEGIQGFAEVVVAPSWGEGANYAIQLTGIGGLVPNTVLLGWPEDWKKRPKKAKTFVDILQTALAADKAVLAMRGLGGMPSDTVHGTIDIWWMIHDGGFLILLSWILVQHRIWRKCQLRVFTICEGCTAEEAKAAGEMLTASLRQHRLFDVNVEVILADADMIEPYTQDWTLREEERHRFLQELHESRGGAKGQKQKEDIPLGIEDLFTMAGQGTEKKSTEAKQVITKGANETVNQDQGAQGLVSVTDARNRDDQGGRQRRRMNRREQIGSDSNSQQPHPAGEQHVAADAPSLMADDVARGSSEAGGKAHVDSPSGEDVETATASNPPGILSGMVRQETPNVGTPTNKGGDEATLRLNKLIVERSKRAQLVVMNLPGIHGNGQEEAQNFMQYCETLTLGLERVLLVHSSGHEIIDISSM